MITVMGKWMLKERKMIDRVLPLREFFNFFFSFALIFFF